MIRYDTKDDVSCRLGPGGGRPGKETGAVSLVWGDSPSSRGEGKTMTPEEATAQVLEQVQRTFLHLRDGERRFFDPIRLVEACRCLNLEYLVHQQNDASEFCDKLLDRVESGMKAGQMAVAAAAGGGRGVSAPAGGGGGGGGRGGGGSGKPSVAALERLFGGTWVHQKIPTGCSHRTNRSEPFINLEVNIRGKESLQESLASFVESELMAGDNKVGRALLSLADVLVLMLQCCCCFVFGWWFGARFACSSLFRAHNLFFCFCLVPVRVCCVYLLYFVYFVWSLGRWLTSSYLTPEHRTK